MKINGCKIPRGFLLSRVRVGDNGIGERRRGRPMPGTLGSYGSGMVSERSRHFANRPPFQGAKGQRFAFHFFSGRRSGGRKVWMKTKPKRQILHFLSLTKLSFSSFFVSFFFNSVFYLSTSFSFFSSPLLLESFFILPMYKYLFIYSPPSQFMSNCLCVLITSRGCVLRQVVWISSILSFHVHLIFLIQFSCLSFLIPICLLKSVRKSKKKKKRKSRKRKRF